MSVRLYTAPFKFTSIDAIPSKSEATIIIFPFSWSIYVLSIVGLSDDTRIGASSFAIFPLLSTAVTYIVCSPLSISVTAYSIFVSS